jgi:uncharacterized protein YchJ
MGKGDLMYRWKDMAKRVGRVEVREFGREVVKVVTQGKCLPVGGKVGKDLCDCGSGKRWDRCCGKAEGGK